MRIGSSTRAEPTLAPRDGRRGGTRGVGRRRARRAPARGRPDRARRAGLVGARRRRRHHRRAAGPPGRRGAPVHRAGRRRAGPALPRRPRRAGRDGSTPPGAPTPQRTRAGAPGQRAASGPSPWWARAPTRRATTTCPGSCWTRPTPCSSPRATPGAVAHARRARVLVATVAGRCGALRGTGRAGGRAGGQRRPIPASATRPATWTPSPPTCCAPRRTAGGSWEGPGGPGRWDGGGAARAGRSTPSAAATRSPRA